MAPSSTVHDTSHESAPASLASVCVFDWYECTMDDVFDEDRMADGLLASLPGTVKRYGKPRQGYGRMVELLRGEKVLAQVLSRSSRVGEVHLSVTGSSCVEVVPVIRRLWPAHRVSRADVAVDLFCDWNELQLRGVAFCESRVPKPVSHSVVMDSAGGATRYLGSRKSPVCVRVYRKTEQLRAKNPQLAETYPDGLVRVELMLRPNKRVAKEQAATLSAAELWGMAGWGLDLARDLLSFATGDAAPVQTQFHRPSSWSRSLYYLGQQYGPSIRERAASVGLPALLAELVGAFGLDPAGLLLLDEAGAVSELRCDPPDEQVVVPVPVGSVTGLEDIAVLL